jgi:beta-galactosidase
MTFSPMRLALAIAAVLAIGAADASAASAASHTFAIGDYDFVLDGKHFQIRCGEMHAARIPREYWRQRLKMAKAMGLNTVCAYLFWNLHEPTPGHFVWTGQADDAEFCRIAQEEGLWVILRPGPYSCAEWEMGGTPWWLLNNDGIKLRSRDPRYLDPATAYLKEVGRVLGPLQITHGGPIIMAQVENEYGYFGKDPEYIEAIRHALINAGFNVPLFECNPPSEMANGLDTTLFQAANFGGDPKGNFRKLRQFQPNGPLICSEFYPGWFDTWGQPHHYGKTEKYLADLDYMLSHDASFSIYMAHGGTTFGLWSGCDRPFKPDTSSYDYDAPISEAGWTTKKFFETRDLISKHLLPGEVLPDPPPQYPVIAFSAVQLTKVAPVFANLRNPSKYNSPPNMESCNQGYGCILYRTLLPAGPSATLQTAAIHDFGYVFFGGKRLGILDRRDTNVAVTIPARDKDSQLDILVEPMGRINFGPEMADHKGLIGPVTLDGQVLKGWEIFNLPLDAKMLAHLKFTSAKPPADAPAFWRGTFRIEHAGDTFLDLRGWGKGDLWVNGHCLGRYWNIGPTQTAFAPGCWLHAGKNEIVILDLEGPEDPSVAGLDKPILDTLRAPTNPADLGRPAVE